MAHSKPRIGINGFGQIGRLVMRTGLALGTCDFVAVNDPFMTVEYMVYKLKYDSTHGRYESEITSSDDELIIGTQKIKVFHEKDPKMIPWSEAGADYIVESSGSFTTKENASLHLINATKVIICAPSPDAQMFVMGVNHKEYQPHTTVVSCASSTINCLALLVKVINDLYGIEEALITTVHAIAAAQKAAGGLSIMDWRGCRGAGQNIIPVNMDAANAVGKIIPELQQKLTGNAFRVPTPHVSVLDMTARLSKPIVDGHDGLKLAVQNASEDDLRGILGYTEEAVVSTDLCGNTNSAIFDASTSLILNEKFVKVVAWYDNEVGYCNRIIDLIHYMHVVDTIA